MHRRGVDEAGLRQVAAGEVIANILRIDGDDEVGDDAGREHRLQRVREAGDDRLALEAAQQRSIVRERGARRDDHHGLAGERIADRGHRGPLAEGWEVREALFDPGLRERAHRVAVDSQITEYVAHRLGSGLDALAVGRQRGLERELLRRVRYQGANRRRQLFDRLRAERVAIAIAIAI